MDINRNDAFENEKRGLIPLPVFWVSGLPTNKNHQQSARIEDYLQKE
jgi:hypothetical protein